MGLLTAVDLFAGAGGLSEGFVQAGFTVVFAHDIDAEFGRTFCHNHPGVPFLSGEEGKIENIGVSTVLSLSGLRRGQLDVLIGGPPCQGFSINAPVRDLSDPRNHLFRHYLRIVDGLRPKCIVMENVPGLLSLGRGKVLKDIYYCLGQMGYRLSHKVLLAAHYGVPQERWRVFVIGARPPGAPLEFPAPTHYATGRLNFTGARELTYRLNGRDGLPSFVSVKDAIDDLPPLKSAGGHEQMPYSRGPSSEYQRQMRIGSEKVLNHLAPRLSPINLKRLEYIRPGGSWRDIPRGLLPMGMKRARLSDHTKRYGRMQPGKLSCTIMTKADPHWGAYFHYAQDRAITVREAARLQSFPDRYRFFGPRVSQYVQVGNAVPPLMAKAVALRVADALMSRFYSRPAARLKSSRPARCRTE